MTLVELIAAVLSASGVWLTTRRHPACWPVGLVSVVVYAWVFVDAKLYSDALLQGAFGVMIGYGWVRWVQHLGTDGRVRIARLPPGRATWHVALGALGALALGAVMRHYTDAALPWLDATLTAYSLVAQWWQAQRHTAAWWLWIVVDVVYVGEYVYKDLRITAVLYALFVAMAVAGLQQWRQAGRMQATASGFGT
ncbi:MAG: nicotinamide riboside transporter PnuC [Rhodanobacter sp.]|nr:MAG: nicotinamide riboside transporter PnuC [Rhodanobacter sp.]TAM14635.1 MAG: nicotinamide riboside transporter PnuC [Rhodanobacter sp.]TAM37427.1 MAG: nicotinamide riboside transporter PnuC [Rhodanobacter sp.]